MRNLLTHSLRRYYYIFAAFIILAAILLQSARILVPHISTLHSSIEQFLSKEFDAEVSLGNIDASWYGLYPRVVVDHLLMTNSENAHLLSVKKADFSLDILHSLVNFQWTWKQVVFHEVYLNVQQSTDGSWKIAGFSTHNNKVTSWNYHSPIELFNITPQVDIRHITAQVTFVNQKTIIVSVPSIQIENAEDFHRLKASAQVGETKVLSLTLERKDTDKEDDHYAVGFVQLNQFPLDHIIHPLLNSELGLANQASTLPKLHQQSSIDLSLWFNFDHKGSFDVVGHVTPLVLQGLPFIKGGRLSLTAQADISGNYEFGRGWNLGLRNVVVDDSQTITQLQLSGTESNPVQLAVDRIALQSWSQWLGSKLIKATSVKSLITKLDLQGELENILISFPDADLQQTKITANANAVSAKLMDKSFGLGNISGYLESQLSDGFLNLSGQNFSLFPSTIYREPIHFDQVNGQIAWQWKPETNSIVINSNAIDFSGDFGLGTGYFLLDIPWKLGSTRWNDLQMQVGVRDGSSEHYQPLIPDKVPKQLMDWLTDSIQSGSIPQAGLIYRSSSSEKHTQTLQLFLDVEQLELQSKGWPSLTNTQAKISIDNQYIEAVATKAQILGENINRLSFVWPGDGAGMLKMHASSQIAAESGLRLLKESVLKNKVGDTFDTWSITGDIRVDASIDIPVLKRVSKTSLQQSVNIQLLENNIQLPEQKLTLESVIGQVNFSNEKGVYADSLRGVVFDRSLEFSLQQEKRGQSRERVLIKGKGSVEAVKLANWLSSPELLMVEGVIPYTFEILSQPVKNNKGLIIKAQSNLLGTVINMPAPFLKKKNQEMPLHVLARLNGKDSQYEISLGQNITASVALTGTGRSGFLAINRKAGSVPENTFLLFASLDRVNVDQWAAALEEYHNKKSQFPISRRQSIPLDYDIDVQTLSYKEEILKNLTVRGSHSGGVWTATVDSQRIQGNIQVDDTFSTPIKMDLNYLHIVNDNSGNADALLVDPWADVDFSVIKPIEVSIKQLHYKDKPLKNVSFLIEAGDYDVVVKNIKADLGGLSLAGMKVEGEAETGAMLSWSKKDNQWQSQFTGRLSGGDIRSLFDDWHLSPVVESGSTEIDMRVSWLGTPAFFSVGRLMGDVKFSMEDGIFLKNKQPVTTDVLRLLSLMNFNTWARRLRLDFSDLYKKGIVFDRMGSRLDFNNGKIYFREPLYVQSPSSEFTLAGAIDYTEKNINAVLITTLPISGNLAFVTAFASGFSAAVGVYLVGKIFKPQVDRVSSLNYTIKGGWEKPKVTFVGLFGDRNNPSGAASDTVERLIDEPRPQKNGD